MTKMLLEVMLAGSIVGCTPKPFDDSSNSNTGANDTGEIIDQDMLCIEQNKPHANQGELYGVNYSADGLVANIFLTEGSCNVALLKLHGGGYTSGGADLTIEDEFVIQARSEGYTVIDIEYSLAHEENPSNTTPRAYYPQQLVDIQNATTYAINNADELGIDPNKMFIVGESAGAALGLNAILQEYVSVAGIVTLTGGCADYTLGTCSTSILTLYNPESTYSQDDFLAEVSPLTYVNGDENTPMFRGVGLADDVVPAEQIYLLSDAIQKQNPEMRNKDMIVHYEHPYGHNLDEMPAEEYTKLLQTINSWVGVISSYE